jgi:hypothetical protein
MKQAIVTRKLPPTNHRGVRYNARTVKRSAMFTRGKDFPHDLPDDRTEHIVVRVGGCLRLPRQHHTMASLANITL